ncbi:MAG: glucose-6-phosphate isomerase [Peptococcaceae bacterium]|jgi:glucose-6-phosphate isomerase|nr:glucose-6-phosphate isomerase [Peptococcaceae bacterium]
MAKAWRTYQSGDGKLLGFDNGRLKMYLDFSSATLPAAGAPDGRGGPAAAGAAAAVELTSRLLAAARDTEAGKIVNPDENRMAGHYWLRAPALAPTPEIRDAIMDALAEIKDGAAKIHSGQWANPAGGKFRYLVVIGIGGSQLGFQLAAKALTDQEAPLIPGFLDNTDPESVYRLTEAIGADHWAEVLFVVASKSGGTAEISNCYKLLEQIYEDAGLSFGRQALAVTVAGSPLERYAQEHQWLATFPVWEWVGGRFSLLSPVGLLPLTLLGADIESLLAGAGAMDELTRREAVRENPALALTHYLLEQTQKRQKKNMVILPYKDRLELWGKYLQQLVMESLGKQTAGPAGIARHGITVLGNKGSTDQHSYAQQLLEGNDDFFAILFDFLLDDVPGQPAIADGGITMGDYLSAFCHGTLNAMRQKGREALLITLNRLDPYALGGLIALFERIVGFYAAALGINPYHQPGVEAGKKSAGEILRLKREVSQWLAEPAAGAPGASGGSAGGGGSGSGGSGGADGSGASGSGSGGSDSGKTVAALKSRFSQKDYRTLFYLLLPMRENAGKSFPLSEADILTLLEG